MVFALSALFLAFRIAGEENKASGLLAYRLSLFSFVVFITASLAWFIILAIEPRGAGATFGLLYPFAAFLFASAFNLLPLIGGLILVPKCCHLAGPRPEHGDMTPASSEN